MRIPYSWLKEYLSVDLSPLEIAKILTSLGVEVDAIEEVVPCFQNVVVGRVLEATKHPEADKLRVAQVTDGSETFQVVCGAPNCLAGMKVAFAKIGAQLKDSEGKDFKIKKAKLRGVESMGMLCAADELGLSGDHEGIISLPGDLPDGMDLASYYGETIFEVSLTPNLGHCLSVIGVARELAAATGTALRLKKLIPITDGNKRVQDVASVTVVDKIKCPRYSCRVITGVAVAPSPGWLQKRLEACGHRPINNIVDITNYVLMEMGHPLHAFDFDKLSGHKIVIRCPEQEKSFVTLDGIERPLDEQTLLICDEKNPVCVAGVMGGQNSEVASGTVNILLESAYFDPRAVRRASKRLGLQTDASKRFERGCDPNATLVALDAAAALIQEIAGGTVLEGVIDIKEGDFLEKRIPCRLSRVNQLLGIKLGVSEVEKIFKQLFFSTQWDGIDLLTVQVPTFRTDIKGEVDLIEEVARIYGYDNIIGGGPRYQSSTLSHSGIFLFEREVRSRLVAEGLQEFITCDLLSPSQVDLVPEAVMAKEAIVRVMNPVSIDQSVLRPSMFPGLLQLIKYNYDRQNQDVSGFEIGRIHYKHNKGFHEQLMAGLVLTGRSRPHHWDQKPSEVDFFDLKGVLESFFAGLGIEPPTWKISDLGNLHSGRQAGIYIDSLKIGFLGEVHPSILRKFDISQRVMFAELNLHLLIQKRQKDFQMRPLALFPGSERDWTITLADETPIDEVMAHIHRLSTPLLESVALIDVYKSEQLGSGRKNVTFRFMYRDIEKTVSQQVVDAEHGRIVEGTVQLLG